MYKIGEEIILSEDLNLASLGKDDEIVLAKSGDKGIVTKRGLMMLTGESRGCIVLSENIGNKYDAESIAKHIFNSLIVELGNDFEDFLEENDFLKEDLIDTICGELEEFI